MARLFDGSLAIALVVGAATLVATPVLAAGERIQVGVLECSVAANSNFLVGSTRRLQCLFKPAGGGATESYRGEITRVGIDLGKAQGTEIVWGVFAPKTGARGALAGKYAGVSAEATAGGGLGANALIGGLNRSIALNPLSVQTQQGLNIAAGVAGLKLTRQ